MTRLLHAIITLSLAALAHLQEPAKPVPPEKSAEPQAPAQIELLETKVRFETNGDSRKEVHALVKINSELGIQQFARLNFDYNRSFQQIEIPLVRVTHSSGGTADILPSAVTDNPNPAVVNFPAYHDVRVKSVRILGLAPSDTLEYRVITTTTHHPLAPDFWLDHTFDRSGVVSHEIFDLDLPGDVRSTTRMAANVYGPLPVIYVNLPWTSTEHSGEGASARSKYRWEIPATRKLPPPLDDNDSPSPDLVVSSFRAWNDLVHRLAPPFLRESAEDLKEIQDRLHEFNGSAGSTDKALRASYEFLSQKIRTLDLPVGASGYRIRPVRDILDSGYGTPEEKCSLMAKFAALAGYKAEVWFAGPPGMERQFPRPSVLNHVFTFVSVKKKRFALDPSVEVAPFGVIPSQFRGKIAFTLTPHDLDDVTDLIEVMLPTDLPFPASQRVTVDATLANDGKLTAKVKYTMRGDNELLLRVAFHQSPREKWNEVAQLLSLSDGFRGKVEKVSASDPYATKDPFTVEYEITQPKFVGWSKKPVRIPAVLPLVGLPDPPTDAKSPIELGTSLDVQTSLTLQLPPGTTVESPAGTTVERDYATFSSKYAASGNTITAARHTHFIAREIPANRTADYSAFVHAVQNDQAQRYTLTNPGIPAVKPANPAKPQASAQRHRDGAEF